MPRFKDALTLVTTYAEKLNALDQPSLTRWAADCAEHVLSHFEEQRPHDERPRRAIEAARNWVRAEFGCSKAREAAVAAHSAARECDHPAAKAAARATGHAAATAHMPAHAQDAAAYALLAVMMENPDAALAERDWQVRQLKRKPPYFTFNG